jgi:hypothetical protein
MTQNIALSEDDLAYLRLPPSRSIYRPRSGRHKIRQPLAERSCGYCGWSWAAGKKGQLLCMNPESPYCYDIVPADLSCQEQSPETESA